MPWPASVVRQFEKVPPNPSEADFHGPYNKLLHTLFPPDTKFTVVPQFWPGSHESADFLVTFEVMLEDQIVFILELKPPGDLRYISRCAAADRQIRARMVDVDNCPLPTLHAVSAMGTKLCFYKQPRNGRVSPRRIPSDPEMMVDVAPRERWDCDILEEDGVQRFQAVVEEIKQGCSAL
ncbi:hypothetical protein BD414DRAFT_249661 [Trametes punicea]|nr:hypothetical protein BD414DRAFT_249661 [Trametes punicea]